MIHSKAVRMSALFVGAGLVAASLPATAQTRRAETSAERRARQAAQQPGNQPPANPQGQTPAAIQVNPREARALAPLQAAATAAQAQGAGANWAPVAALVPAAESAIQSNEGRYYLAKFKYSIAVGQRDQAGQEAALTALSTNSVTPAAELAQVRQVLSRFPHLRAEAAFAARDFATAERIYREILRTNPGDTIAQRNLGATLSNSGNTAGRLELVEEQIRAAQANGAKAPEALLRQAHALASAGNNAAVTAAALQRLVTAYPTPQNWRAAFDTVRSVAREDTQFLVDIYRFGRIANVIKAEEYVPLVNTFGQAAILAETKITLEAGLAAGAIQPTQVLNPNNAPSGGRPARQLVTDLEARMRQEQTGLAGELTQARGAANGRQASNIGDALYGYGRFTEAADAYRLALSKGGVDANLVNTRIGASLAQAGRRAEAETVLRSVTGPRAGLAGLWLTWLATRPA